MVPPRTHYPGLDVLRGIAVVLVVVYHYFAFPFGWIGVDLFFVLSGFLITGILLRTSNSQHYFRDFFVRRMLRIFPVYFFTLGAFFLSCPFMFSEKGPGTVYTYYTDHQAWFWTFTQNWLVIKESIPPEPFLQHFWSLAVEEQFYIFWPFLIAFVRKPNNQIRVIASLFLFALFLRLFFHLNDGGFEPFYYNTFARMDSLSAGALLAVLKMNSIKIPQRFFQVVTGSLFIYLLVQGGIYQNWQHNALLSATIGYSISALFFMGACYRMQSSSSAFATNKLLRSIGRISYGIYIYHVPVLLVTSKVLGNQLKDIFQYNVWQTYAIPVFSLLITLLLSVISFQLIEQPFLHLKKKFT